MLRCAVSLAVAVALSRAVRLDGRPRAGVGLLVAWAVCSGLLAFFADDLEGQPVHGSGAVHIAPALIAFPCVAIGAILVSASLRSEPGWRSAGAVLLGVSIAGAAAFLLLGSATGHKHAPGGCTSGSSSASRCCGSRWPPTTSSPGGPPRLHPQRRPRRAALRDRRAWAAWVGSGTDHRAR